MNDLISRELLPGHGAENFFTIEAMRFESDIGMTPLKKRQPYVELLNTETFLAGN